MIVNEWRQENVSRNILENKNKINKATQQNNKKQKLTGDKVLDLFHNWRPLFALKYR